MDQFNYLIAAVLALVTFLVIKVSLKYVNSTIEKFYIIFISIFTFIYSGAGIAFEEVAKKYIFSYISFIILLLLGMIIGFKLFNANKEYRFINSLTTSNRWIINLSTLLYWVIILVRLVYPNNRLSYLFNISISVNDVFANQIANRSNTVVYIMGLVLLVIRPFYYIFLYKMKSKYKAILLIVLEIYIGVVISGYIGRSGLIVNVLMILFIFVFKKYNKKYNFNMVLKNKKVSLHENSNKKKEDIIMYKKFIKVFAIIIMITIFFLPLLFDYQNMRLGVSASNVNASEKISELLKIEFAFPKLYDEAELFSNSVSPINYFIWLFTLIIPKKLIAVNHIMLINYDFTTFITGIQYGQSGFSVFLPSILGEGIMLYGTYFACLHGLVIGLISGMFCSFFRKSQVLSLWNIYILFQLLLMPRGGSQGTISGFINGSILIMICAVMDVFIAERRNKA
ncbi:hypothetical protein [Clostridium sp. UBA5712]|uniref:hypothetical protein n=1 Tax=Clostridium sp. UBA5712 TaxID=1946368 RepID=UPI003217E796